MGIIRLIVNLIQALISIGEEKVLTPKGECFFNYIHELKNGSDDRIESYEDDIETIRLLMEEELGCSWSREEAIDYLQAYYNEEYL